jgi:threonine aldolase
MVAVAPQACVALESWLKERGILAQVLPKTRFVTHLDVDAEQIDHVCESIRAYFRQA